MRSSTKSGGRIWFVLVAAALAGVAALFALMASPHRRASAPADAPESAERPAPVAYRERFAFPSGEPPQELAAPAPAATESPRPAFAPPPPPATLGAERSEPPASPQTATAWISSYRSAVCGCKTRACVRDLQAGFLHAAGSTTYQEERDSALYAEASRAAIRCYAQLPADS